MGICLMMKASMRGRNNYLRFSHTTLTSMGCGVEGPSIYGVVGVFCLWSMGFGLKGSSNFKPFKDSFSSFFKDYASHSIIKVWKISQTL
jgi:hypothetical protein